MNVQPFTSHPLTDFFLTIPQPPTCTLFPYTTLFRSPDYFMFNNPESACRTCGGLGVHKLTHPELLEPDPRRSEEHTSELQSPMYLVCRLLLEKKKKQFHKNSPLPVPKV